MFNLKNRDRLVDPKDVAKAGLKPALYDPPGAMAKPAPGVLPRPSAPTYAPVREGLPAQAYAPARGTDGPGRSGADRRRGAAARCGSRRAASSSSASTSS